jgi:hypothetical protein
MILYNYVAGGPFPPEMPEGFSPWKFGRCDIAAFVFSTGADHAGWGLAQSLQVGPYPRGLVFSFSPENRDFKKAADFFRVPSFPACVVVPYSTFAEQLCVEKQFDRSLGTPFGPAAWITNLPEEQSEAEGLTCLITPVDTFGSGNAGECLERIIDASSQFIKGVPASSTGFVRKIGRREVNQLRNGREILPLETEIYILFTRPALRHTQLEKIIYDTFVQFGAATDDVLVRILYPNYQSDEYKRVLETYDIGKEPAAIFKKPSDSRAVIKLERDFFEGIPRLEDNLHNIVSDLHRAIARGRTTTARRIVGSLRVPAALTATYSQTARVGTQILHLKAENVLIRQVAGDFVAGNKIQGQSV